MPFSLWRGDTQFPIPTWHSAAFRSGMTNLHILPSLHLWCGCLCVSPPSNTAALFASFPLPSRHVCCLWHGTHHAFAAVAFSRDVPFPTPSCYPQPTSPKNCELSHLQVFKTGRHGVDGITPPIVWWGHAITSFWEDRTSPWLLLPEPVLFAVHTTWWQCHA